MIPFMMGDGEDVHIMANDSNDQSGTIGLSRDCSCEDF